MRKRGTSIRAIVSPLLAGLLAIPLRRYAARAARRERFSGERLTAVLDQAPLAIHLFAADGRSLLKNRSWSNLWEGTSASARGGNILRDPQIQATGLVPYLRAGISGQTLTTPPLLFDPARTGDTGARRWLQGYIAPIKDRAGAVREVLLIEEDVTERRGYEEQLRLRALHDPLTGLPNRVLLLDRLEQALARAARDGQVALLLLDLDRFKGVNDSLGHPAGDRLLIEVARLLTSVVRPGDTVARLGGDEFAVLADELPDLASVTGFAERLLRTLGDTVVVDGQEITPQASLGIAFGGFKAVTTDELLRNADVAMYAAKRSGGGRYALYDAAMRDGVRERLTLEADLRRAIAGDELVLYFQPIKSVADERLIGMETLLRWRHPTRGLLGPQKFVSLAEETGLIRQLGHWVLREACRQLRSWQDRYAGATAITINVNLSARQFGDAQLVADIARVLRETGLSPAALTLELTESTVMGDAAAAALTLQELRQLGLRLAIDDFGTGYSNLAYLQRFPIDTLKLDRSFIAGIEHDARGAALAKAAISLGKALGLTTIAEGIETAATLEQLRGFGCDAAQGYYFARPMHAEEIEKLLQ